MPEFIRVRPVRGVQHEYDTPLAEVQQNPDLYVVIDDKPVPAPREPKYVTSTPPAKAPKPPRKRTARPAAKPPTPEASVGETTEGEG
jgi:hypothetical protein